MKIVGGPLLFATLAKPQVIFTWSKNHNISTYLRTTSEHVVLFIKAFSLVVYIVTKY